MRILIILLAASVLSSCSAPAATATKYRPAYIFGGYSEKEIEPGVWRVTGRSNGVAESGFGRNMAAYRAAELLKGKGFSHMQVIDQKGKERYFGVGGAPATSRAGEFLTLTVRGANGPAPPSDCRAKRPDQCFTLDIDVVMARLRPLLRIDQRRD